jgi:hypothetical protein
VHPQCFVAVDITGDFLHEAVAGLRVGFPGLDVRTVVADLNEEITLPGDLTASSRGLKSIWEQFAMCRSIGVSIVEGKNTNRTWPNAICVAASESTPKAATSTASPVFRNYSAPLASKKTVFWTDPNQWFAVFLAHV